MALSCLCSHKPLDRPCMSCLTFSLCSANAVLTLACSDSDWCDSQSRLRALMAITIYVKKKKKPVCLFRSRPRQHLPCCEVYSTCRALINLNVGQRKTSGCCVTSATPHWRRYPQVRPCARHCLAEHEPQCGRAISPEKNCYTSNALKITPQSNATTRRSHPTPRHSVFAPARAVAPPQRRRSPSPRCCSGSCCVGGRSPEARWTRSQRTASP